MSEGSDEPMGPYAAPFSHLQHFPAALLHRLRTVSTLVARTALERHRWPQATGHPTPLGENLADALVDCSSTGSSPHTWRRTARTAPRVPIAAQHTSLWTRAVSRSAT